MRTLLALVLLGGLAPPASAGRSPAVRATTVWKGQGEVAKAQYFYRPGRNGSRGVLVIRETRDSLGGAPIKRDAPLVIRAGVQPLHTTMDSKLYPAAKVVRSVPFVGGTVYWTTDARGKLTNTSRKPTPKRVHVVKLPAHAHLSRAQLQDAVAKALGIDPVRYNSTTTFR